MARPRINVELENPSPGYFCVNLPRLSARRLVFIEVFTRHVIFRYFAGVYFSCVMFPRVFNPCDYSSLERIPFFNQLVNAFRIGTLHAG